MAGIETLIPQQHTNRRKNHTDKAGPGGYTFRGLFFYSSSLHYPVVFPKSLFTGQNLFTTRFSDLFINFIQVLPFKRTKKYIFGIKNKIMITANIHPHIWLVLCCCSLHVSAQYQPDNDFGQSHPDRYTIVYRPLSRDIPLQDDYPIPEKTPTRLFYIQHSNNHNTYVYDARMKGRSIDREDPVDAYRIVYTEGGVKKPLNIAQRKMAYGMVTDYVSPDFFALHLAASKKLEFYLTLDRHGKPKVYTTVKNRKIYLDRMFVKLKDKTAGLHIKADWILFEGKDFHTAEKVSIKIVPED
ncbi:protein of unknown function [Sinomicrobium oceani]|uniref:DUF4833 domain-containing protein n=2 Tax=Sinomicrobium oceani TaxID=1150368 RepID=A0A1K1PXJ9_9FLAO|nr:protein of unknown function [Sinomicrobium oceani]